jgi:3-oxoacyl-[acyl-carrier protein] reductase
MEHTKKVAVISGGGGVGRETAKVFKEKEYEVFLLSRNDSREHEDDCRFITCDISDSSAVTKAVAGIVEEMGRIDVAVHTAVSPMVTKKIVDMDVEEFKKEFQVGVFGGFNFLRDVARVMKVQKSGSIVALSTSYLSPGVYSPHVSGYISAKFAQRGFLRELAKELAPFGVRVNAVAPSFMETPLTNSVPERMLEFLKEKNPFHSLVTPSDVAGVIVFLCSEQARALTGLHIPVTYGETLEL